MSNPETQSQYARLLAGLENSRWDAMGILADSAEDEGNTTLASGWRYLAEHHKWPTTTACPKQGRPKGNRSRVWYEWITGMELTPRESAGEHTLPVEVYDRMRELRTEYQDYAQHFARFGHHRTDDAYDPWRTHVDSLLCDDLAAQLQLAARAAGEWLASQQKKESER
jgi:hypothetical protein